MRPNAAPAGLTWESLAPDAASERRGGMGSVFKARWARRGGVSADVAVKLLRVSELTDAAYAKAAADLEREAETLRLASAGGASDFVVPLWGVARGPATPAWASRLGGELALFSSRGGAGELCGLVMSWEGGGSLAEHIHDGGRAAWLAKRTSERLRLLERVAEGVSLLHSAAPLVVHGDLKPENVLLSSEFKPRLADFGVSKVKAALTTGHGSTTVTGRGPARAGGTWLYKAPEMYGAAAIAEPNRRTDVFALATLCWEALAASPPIVVNQGRDLNDEVSRAVALLQGASLDWARLPDDIPIELRALLQRSVAINHAARPAAVDLHAGLRAARERLESGRFDVFLSHAWEGNAHAPATVAVHHALHAAGRRLWVDKAEMGHHRPESMRAGIAASTVFVVLVSKKFASRPDCMLELREARDTRKPIVACIVEPDAKWWPKTNEGTATEREMASAINTAVYMVADLRRACAANASAAAASGGGAPLQRDLLDAPEALQALLKLVADKLGPGITVSGRAAAANGGSSGSGGGGGGGGGGSIANTHVLNIPEMWRDVALANLPGRRLIDSRHASDELWKMRGNFHIFRWQRVDGAVCISDGLASLVLYRDGADRPYKHIDLRGATVTSDLTTLDITILTGKEKKLYVLRSLIRVAQWAAALKEASQPPAPPAPAPAVGASVFAAPAVPAQPPAPGGALVLPARPYRGSGARV